MFMMLEARVRADVRVRCKLLVWVGVRFKIKDSLIWLSMGWDTLSIF